MTANQAKKKIDVARKFGRAKIFDEADGIAYTLWFDEDRSEFSLTYKDGLHEYTIICTWNTRKIIDLLTA